MIQWYKPLWKPYFGKAKHKESPKVRNPGLKRRTTLKAKEVLVSKPPVFNGFYPPLEGHIKALKRKRAPNAPSSTALVVGPEHRLVSLPICLAVFKEPRCRSLVNLRPPTSFWILHDSTLALGQKYLVPKKPIGKRKNRPNNCGP